MSDAAPPRRKRIDREHCLQKHLKLWVRENLPNAVFLAFDRAPARGQFSHMVQKARGVVRGTPDTVLLMPEMHEVWCELKAPGNKPDDAQTALGEKLAGIGHMWFWATSVGGYLWQLEQWGIVPIDPRLRLAAQDHDARVQGEIERAEMKSGRLPKRLAKPRPSPSRTRAWAKVQMRMGGGV